MKKLIWVLFALSIFSCGVAFSEDLAIKRAEEYQSKIPVSLVKRITLPKGYHEGLFFDDRFIWVSNGEGKNTWLIDPATGSIASEITSPGSFTEGIVASGDGTFWVTDWLDKKLYRTTLENGKMIIKHAIDLAPAHPAGLVWTGRRLFVVTWTRGLGTKFHLLEFDEKGNLLGKIRIKRIHEPAHLGWDGKHLWITSWYNQLVYKIDTDKFKILGSFKSPAPDTTGITWDGRYFWVTGTHADLYQLEVGRSD